MLGVVIDGYLGFYGWSVKGLLGSKSGLYCGVWGLRAVLWSSCVMTMKLSCHLRLIGLDQPTSGSKLTDPPSVFHCLSLSFTVSLYSLISYFPSADPKQWSPHGSYHHSAWSKSSLLFQKAWHFLCVQLCPIMRKNPCDEQDTRMMGNDIKA